MAYAMTKQGSLDNCVTYEFICDAIEDMNAIEDRYRTIGSIAIVLQGTSGLEVYISGSDKQWNSLSSIGSSAADGLSIHICGQNEVSNGLPNISEPDETSIYLVPAADASSGNLYDEYVYVDSNWEKFGGGGSNIDLSSYAPKASPVFTGSISLGRASGSTIGNGSVSEGYDVVASGDYSHAEGDGEFEEPITIDGNTYTAGGAYGNASHAEGIWTLALEQGSHVEGWGAVASGSGSHAEGEFTAASGMGAHAEGENTTSSNYASHAEGNLTTASGDSSHAEGYETTASNNNAHAEGGYTIASGYGSHAEGGNTTASEYCSHAEGYGTVASGEHAHAEGENTIAAGGNSHVAGKFNVADDIILPEWTANTQYNVGDRVKRTITQNNSTIIERYKCSQANHDASFDGYNWSKDNEMHYIEIIGNGTTDNARSNARVLDWSGNERLKGDIYVGCNANSSGGTKLARIPDPPSTDGTYILQATISSGVITYTWVAGA